VCLGGIKLANFTAGKTSEGVTRGRRVKFKRNLKEVQGSQALGVAKSKGHESTAQGVLQTYQEGEGKQC